MTAQEIIFTLNSKPKLAQALAAYVYADRFVNTDAARILARNEVAAHLPRGVVLDELLLRYSKVSEALETTTTMTWECGDVVEVTGGAYGDPIKAEVMKLGDYRSRVTPDQLSQAIAARKKHVVEVGAASAAG